MFKKLGISVVFLTALLLGMIVQAQDDEEQELIAYSFYPVEEVDDKSDDDVYGPIITLPEGWELSIDGDAASVSNDLGSDLALDFEVGFSFLVENSDDSDQTMELFDPLLLAQAFDVEQPPEDLPTAFEQYADAADISFDEDDLEEIKVGKRDALMLDNMVLLEMSTGEVALAIINEDWELDDTAEEILTSFDSETAACAVGASQNVNVRQSNSTTTGVVATLDAQTLYLADGQATGGGGFVWWHLLDGGWVRSDVVSEFYNCDSVPVIKEGTTTEQQTQPSQPETTSGSDSGGTSPTAVPQQQQPSSGGSGVVQSGGWTIYLAEKAPFSCAGTGTIELPMTDIFSATSFPIIVTSSGNQIIFDGSLMTSADGTTYTGSLDLGGGDNVQFTATVPSRTQINGSFVINVVASDGTPCSATIGFTARAN